MPIHVSHVSSLGGHLAGLEFLEERLPNPFDELVRGYPQHHDPCEPDEPAARGPVEDAGGRLVGLRRRTGRRRAREQFDRRDAETAVHKAAPEPAEPLERAVCVLRTVTERCADEAPDRIAAEADRKEKEQELTERLARHRPDRALLVGQLPGVADGDLEREQPDDAVDQTPRYEAGARQDLERRGTDNAAADAAGCLNGCRADVARHDRPGSTHSRRAPLLRSRRSALARPHRPHAVGVGGHTVERRGRALSRAVAGSLVRVVPRGLPAGISRAWIPRLRSYARQRTGRSR